jgi:hypothetical protein
MTLPYRLVDPRAIREPMELVPSEDRSRWWFLQRYPATLLLLAALVAAALGTGTAVGELPRRLVNRFGFAPADLWALDLWRLFSSALITQGGASFILALVVVALSSGTVEARVGSRLAFLTFWGSHVWTLLVMSLALGPALADGSPGLDYAIATLRDVGPSAGYFGCVGAAVALQRDDRLRWGGAVGVAAWLAVDLLGWVSGAAAGPGELSADVAHVIAFGSGWVAMMMIWKRRVA